MPNYQPPFTLNNKILTLVAEISNKVGRLSVEFEQSQLRLRKLNRMRTIQGALAIEGNTLSEEQITAMLEGKRVIAPPKEVQEAHNAIAVYDQLDRLPDDGVNDGLNGGVKLPKLPALQVQILDILKTDPHTTVQQLVVATGKSTRTIERHLKALREKHLLERIGPDKTGYWKVLL